ncbi:hypothetical protein ACWEPC_49565 [Nonomuraea sp. NPDC004297]
MGRIDRQMSVIGRAERHGPRFAWYGGMMWFGGVAVSCGEVMPVRPDHPDHLIPVTFINTCDQVRIRTAGEAKVQS